MANANSEIIGKLHETFKSKALRLSVAESCTAGLISHMLTTVPGASVFFDSSVICYSATSKRRLLGIKANALKKHGTVSEETARSMAEAVREKTKTDVSLAVTGVLGPEPVEDKKPGLVFIAVATTLETTSRGFIFEGSREDIKHEASKTALHFLYEAVSVLA